MWGRNVRMNHVAPNFKFFFEYAEFENRVCMFFAVKKESALKICKHFRSIILKFTNSVLEGYQFRENAVDRLFLSGEKFVNLRKIFISRNGDFCQRKKLTFVQNDDH